MRFPNIAIYANGAMRDEPFPGARAHLDIRDGSSDILIAGICPQSLYRSISGSTNLATLYDEVAEPDQFIPYPNMVSLYKRGTIDDSFMYQNSSYTNRIAWNSTHFGEGVSVDPSGNSDSDPFTELFEYAFGLNPFAYDPPNATGFSVERGDNEAEPLYATFVRNSAAIDLNYLFQASLNLKDCTVVAESRSGEATSSEWESFETSHPSNETLKRVTLTLPNTPPLYLRLVIEDLFSDRIMSLAEATSFQ